MCHKVTQELHIRAKDKMEQVWWKVTKKVFGRCFAKNILITAFPVVR